MKLFKGIKELLSLEGVSRKDGRRIENDDLSVVKDACLVAENGILIFAGEESDLKNALGHRWREVQAAEEIDLKAMTVLPAFVEAHTHLVFAGDRSEEFELRNRGVGYQEIAARGGGILSTLQHTRRASFEELLSSAQTRSDRFVSQGVTCLESKSGYCLDLEGELKLLKVSRAIKGPRVVSTFLGAHARPPEFKSPADYLEFLEAKLLPRIVDEKLADRIDIFIEKGFFEAADSQALLKKALSLGLKLTIHADQLSLSGGTELALQFGAQSADHLIQISEDLVKKVAGSQTVAMLLPAADFYMDCAYPPARSLIDQGACVALATDFNPGTSPTQDLSLVGVLSRLKMKMTQAEVISAYTYGAAKSLGLENERGSLEQGKCADFVVLDTPWKELFYQVGHHPVTSVYRQAEVMKRTESEKS